MTEQEMLEQIANLSKLVPGPEKFFKTVSTSKGHGKRATNSTTQQLDDDAYQKALANFYASPAGKQLSSLQETLQQYRDYRNQYGWAAGPTSYAGEIVGAPLAAGVFGKGQLLPPGTSALGRFANTGAWGAASAVPGLMAYLALRAGQDPNRPPWERDAYTGAGSTLAGFAAYPTLLGIRNSWQTVGRPGDGSPDNGGGGGGTPPNGPHGPNGPNGPANPPPPPPAPLTPAQEGATVFGLSEDAARNMSTDQLKAYLKGNLPNATETQKDALASAIGHTRAPGKTFTGSINKLSGWAALAAMLGLGAYGLSGGEAEAGGLPTEGPARDESLTQYRLRSLGLPSTPGEAANAASYAIPYVGEGRMAADIGTAGGQIASALTQPGSVMGNLPDPREAHFQNWVADQRIQVAKQQQFKDTLDDFIGHIGSMKAKYGGAPASGGAVPTGGGMPGLTGIPGAGAGSGPANFAAASSPQAGGLSPGTAAILQAMQAARTQSNALNYLLGRPY